MHDELYICRQCKQDKIFYYDDQDNLVYEEKCLCDKEKLKTKKIDEALKLIGELIKNGQIIYVK